MVLVTTYADGRTSQSLVSERPSRSWGTTYPRLSPMPEDGLRALQIARVRVGNDARVTVSILHGPGLNEEDVIATVTVTRGTPVVVETLRDVGVEPIILSIADTAPTTPYVPSVVSVAPEIEISRIDLLSAPYPGYRVTVRNLAAQSVALFSVQSYRGTAKAISLVPRGDRGRPVMAPGESHTFDLPLMSASAWAPEPLDMIEIDAILWEDGTQTGMHGRPFTLVTASDGGQRLQLDRALRVLHAAEQNSGSAATLLSLLRQGFTALPESDPTRLEAARRSMRYMRTAILRDFDQFERSAPRDAAAVQSWIHATIAKYNALLKHLAA